MKLGTNDSKILAMYPGKATESLLNLDKHLRKRKRELLNKHNLSKESRDILGLAHMYVRNQHSLTANNIIKINGYSNSVNSFNETINQILEQVNENIEVKDIREAEKIIATQSVDGIRASILRLEGFLK